MWKTCVTYIKYESYSKTWRREDGECWSTSRYLFDSRIEVATILSFISCVFIAIILFLYGLLYTSKNWRPFIKSAALPGMKNASRFQFSNNKKKTYIVSISGCKLIEMLVSLAMILVFSEATDVGHNVRLWARHLAMVGVVLMSAEVVFLMSIGCYQYGFKNICFDISFYIRDCSRDFPGSAHRPAPPSLSATNHDIPAPHENVKVNPHEQNILSLRLPPYDLEKPVAYYSNSGKPCRFPIEAILGKPKRHEHSYVYSNPAVEVSPPADVKGCTAQESDEEISVREHTLSYSPRSAELQAAVAGATRRKLPKIPSAYKIPSEEPHQISVEIEIDVLDQDQTPRELDIIQVDPNSV